MGKCWYCDTEVTLSNDNIKCPSCKKTLYYICWNCKKPFEVADENNKKRKECVVCKFFYCPNCSICGKNCKKRNWETFLDGKELPRDKRKIIEYFGIQKVGAEEKRCPRDVGISYGKGKIKTCYLKMLGYKPKNKEDAEKFKKRLGEISEISIGSSTTITKIRQEGTYGQEYRDAFNLGICLGLFKIERKSNPDKNGVDIQMFTRIEGKPCEYWDADKMLWKECPKCKKEFSLEVDYCPICTYKKGSKKNQQIKLKICKSDKDTCQFDRNNYNPIKKEGEDERVVEED